MLSAIDPGMPASISGCLVSEHIRRLSTAAVKGQPLQPTMGSIVSELGFDSFVYAMSPDPNPARRETPSFVWTTLPREWIALYNERGYIEVDPRVTRTYNRNVPLLWDAAEYHDDARCRSFLDDAGRFGVRSGVALSFRDPDHGRVLVAMNSAITPVDDERRTAISRRLGDIVLLALSFHDFFMAQLVGEEPTLALRAPPLSPREEQCLEFAANGMTSVDIALKLGIKPRTANFHFGKLVRKLGVLNRKEAIAMGMARGFIRANPVTMGRGAKPPWPPPR